MRKEKGVHHIDVERARKEMAKRGLDVLIAASLINVCYCTGHFSNLWRVLRDHLRLAVIPKDSEPFVTCPCEEARSFAKSGVFQVVDYPIDVYFNYASGEDLYLKARENIKDIPELKNLDIRDMLAKSPVLLAAKILKGRGLGGAKIGIDKEYVEAAFLEEIASALPHCEIEDGTQIFLDLRAIKSDEEVNNMVEAIRITEKAIETAVPMIKEGVCILDIRRHYIQVMTEKEASEPNNLMLSVSPLPTGQVFSSMEDRIVPGQVFKIDIGVKYDGYACDFARQWAIGEIPTKERALFNTLLEAANAMAEIMQPGTRISDLYRRGNDIVKKVDPNYGRRVFMGHSVGLEAHERPYISPFSEEILKPGMVMCLEVPYYTAGGYGYNVEDEYLITEDGHKLLSTGIPVEMPQI
jgi:Xaa-Pro aminopeptidase